MGYGVWGYRIWDMGYGDIEYRIWDIGYGIWGMGI